MARLIVKNLSKNFGKLRCLDKVSFEIEDGELVTIVGPSGCGKSTLLRCIAGLEEVDEGDIIIDEEIVTSKEPRYRDVAMVFQYYALYPHMSVRQNLSFGLEHTTNLTKREICEKVEEIANTLKISKLLDKKPSQLSGGEAQRVAIGRALIRNPKVFLLDEPLSAIDAKLRRDIRMEIRKIQRKFNVTTIYVTHDQEEAMALGDRIIVLKDGRIHQIGKPEEVFEHPEDIFVASFIGKPPMNFFKVMVKEEDGRHLLKGDSFIYEVSKEYFNKYLAKYVGKMVILGVRPSSVRLVTLDNQFISTKVNLANVSLIENIENEQWIYLSLNSKKIIMKSLAGSYENLKVGETVRFSFEEGDTYIFDVESEKFLKCY